MLVLTRRVGEVMIINENIEVVILGVKGNQVKMGINAPKEIPINRQEIQHRIEYEKTLKEYGEINGNR